MSLALIAKQIRQIPADCSVCHAGGAFVLLPPLVAQADRRCGDHLPPVWRELDLKFSGAFVPPSPLDEARPGAPGTAPSAPVKAGPGDLFGGFD